MVGYVWGMVVGISLCLFDEEVWIGRLWRDRVARLRWFMRGWQGWNIQDRPKGYFRWQSRLWTMSILTSYSCLFCVICNTDSSYCRHLFHWHLISLSCNSSQVGSPTLLRPSDPQIGIISTAHLEELAKPIFLWPTKPCTGFTMISRFAEDWYTSPFCITAILSSPSPAMVRRKTKKKELVKVKISQESPQITILWFRLSDYCLGNLFIAVSSSFTTSICPLLRPNLMASFFLHRPHKYQLLL